MYFFFSCFEKGNNVIKSPWSNNKKYIKQKDIYNIYIWTFDY